MLMLSCYSKSSWATAYSCKNLNIELSFPAAMNFAPNLFRFKKSVWLVRPSSSIDSLFKAICRNSEMLLA